MYSTRFFILIFILFLEKFHQSIYFRALTMTSRLRMSTFAEFPRTKANMFSNFFVPSALSSMIIFIFYLGFRYYYSLLSLRGKWNNMSRDRCLTFKKIAEDATIFFTLLRPIKKWNYKVRFT